MNPFFAYQPPREALRICVHGVNWGITLLLCCCLDHQCCLRGANILTAPLASPASYGAGRRAHIEQLLYVHIRRKPFDLSVCREYLNLIYISQTPWACAHAIAMCQDMHMSYGYKKKLIAGCELHSINLIPIPMPSWAPLPDFCL